jgi:hypothetical protein
LDQREADGFGNDFGVKAELVAQLSSRVPAQQALNRVHTQVLQKFFFYCAPKIYIEINELVPAQCFEFLGGKQCIYYYFLYSCCEFINF